MIKNLFRQVTPFSCLLMAGIIFSISLGFVFPSSFAQVQSIDEVSISEEKIVLSEDLANNPAAQDILKKIEQTKQWIRELEQRNYEQLEKENELNEKRTQALANLQQDLKEWKLLWEYYSPRNSFERFVDKVPDSQIKEVFWNQFEFKEQKVKAGRDALKQVIANGGSRENARQAYLIAAETKRIELIEANSQFNVRHNLAYYNQQILFDKEGQFVDTPITGEQLRKYYKDFRTNPVYLKANPNDVTSWEDLGKTNANTECRDGYLIIYRFTAQDYVCVTISTAEMWIRHGMGEITGESPSIPSYQQQSVNPLTSCDDEFIVLFNNESGKYSCIPDTTAQEWIEEGIGEIHDPEEFIMQSIEQKENLRDIAEINEKLDVIRDNYHNELEQLKKDYDLKYENVFDQLRESERDLIQSYEDKSGMSKEELSEKIMLVREKYESEKEDILDDKVKDSKKLKRTFEKNMSNFIQNFDSELYVEFNTDSGKLGYEAILRQ